MMTRDEIIVRLLKFPNSTVIFDVDVDNPYLNKENGKVKDNGHLPLGIDYIFYDKEKDRIIMSEY